MSKNDQFENAKTRGQTVTPDESAHHELPHLDLHCLQVELFFFILVL